MMPPCGASSQTTCQNSSRKSKPLPRQSKDSNRALRLVVSCFGFDGVRCGAEAARISWQLRQSSASKVNQFYYVFSSVPAILLACMYASPGGWAHFDSDL